MAPSFPIARAVRSHIVVYGGCHGFAVLLKWLEPARHLNLFRLLEVLRGTSHGMGVLDRPVCVHDHLQPNPVMGTWRNIGADDLELSHIMPNQRLIDFHRTGLRKCNGHRGTEAKLSKEIGASMHSSSKCSCRFGTRKASNLYSLHPHPFPPNIPCALSGLASTPNSRANHIFHEESMKSQRTTLMLLLCVLALQLFACAIRDRSGAAFAREAGGDAKAGEDVG